MDHLQAGSGIAENRPPDPAPQRPDGDSDAADLFASIWDESTKAQQRSLFQRIVAVAEVHGLALYLFWGTLLGQVREGRTLPWDDDVDVALFDPSSDQLARFRAACEADGLQIFDRAQGYHVWVKVCDPTAPIQSHAYPWTWPFVDIFIYSSDPTLAGGAWPALQYPPGVVLPGRLTQFEGVRCWEPERPQALLDLQYEGWRHRETSSRWNHRWERRPKAVSTRSILTDARGRKVAAHPATYENPLANGILLPLLRAWIDLCRQHRVDYSIYWGTLLGQVRSRRIIPYDLDIDVVVGKSGMEAVYALPGRVAACVFNDELRSQPAWCEREIRLVVRRDLVSTEAQRYDHRGLRVSTQVDSCAFNGPLARLIIRLPKAADGREYWHLDVDLFTHISRFNPYPTRDDVDDLPECEERPLENLLVSCLKDPAPYLARYYGADYLTPDHVYRDGDWVARG